MTVVEGLRVFSSVLSAEVTALVCVSNSVSIVLVDSEEVVLVVVD